MPNSREDCQCKSLMYSKKGLVYELHARWFINRPLGEFINCGLFNPKEGKVKLNFWRHAIFKSDPGTLILCRKRGASGQGKYKTSSIYTAKRRLPVLPQPLALRGCLAFSTVLLLILGCDMGGCKTYGGGKRTRERALPKIFGPH